jgi:hypothetical protein
VTVRELESRLIRDGPKRSRTATNETANETGRRRPRSSVRSETAYGAA